MTDVTNISATPSVVSLSLFAKARADLTAAWRTAGRVGTVVPTRTPLDVALAKIARLVAVAVANALYIATLERRADLVIDDDQSMRPRKDSGWRLDVLTGKRDVPNDDHGRHQ